MLLGALDGTGDDDCAGLIARGDIPAAGEMELCDPGCCGDEYGARYIGPVGGGGG